MINNKDLKVSEMLELSYKLWDKNKDSWSPMKPEYGKDFILYMIEEIGEVIQIIKKKSIEEIMKDSDIRERLIEELSDVLMYFVDVLNRFDISTEEFSEIYIKKYMRNMKRDYKSQYNTFLINDTNTEGEESSNVF